MPMTEALASGLPVIMTDIDPNNKILPKEWLVPARKKSEFTARTVVEVYSADSDKLAEKIASVASLENTSELKKEAVSIAEREFSDKVVLTKWYGLIERIGL